MLTRKAFLLRASAATAAVAAISVAGAGTADAGAEPHLRSVLELTTNAARQLTRLTDEFPPGPCRPDTTAQLEAILAASADLSATAERMLGACRS